jgi:hypothetical protein
MSFHPHTIEIVGDITDDMIDATAVVACIEAERVIRERGRQMVPDPSAALALLLPKVRAVAAHRGVTDKALVNFLTAGAIVTFAVRVSL